MGLEDKITRNEIRQIIKEAKVRWNEYRLTKKYWKADQMKNKIKLLQKRLK